MIWHTINNIDKYTNNKRETGHLEKRVSLSVYYDISSYKKQKELAQSVDLAVDHADAESLR